jgi:hypothetical protein
VVPAAVVFWIGNEPCLHTFQMPDHSLVLGRDLLESRGIDVTDERVSRQHVRVDHVGDGFRIEDLGSRNGVFVGGQRATATVVRPPAIVRIGHTLLALVEDGARYEGQAVKVLDDGIVVGPTSRRIHRQLADLATEGSHVVIVGAYGSGRREIARAYARSRNLPFLMFDSLDRPKSLAESVTPELSTLIFPEINRLRPEDRATLESLLDRPGFQVLCTSQTRLDTPDRKNPPPDLARRLQQAIVTVPGMNARFDEVPVLMRETVRRIAPQLALHAKAVELELASVVGSFLDVAHDVARCAERVAERGDPIIREEDLDAQIRINHCVVDSRG